MLDAVRAIYRQSRKSHDNFWNVWVSRPPAALVVWALRPTAITPNQVTFSSLAVFAVAAALLVGWRTHAGLLVAALVVQLSYVLDCVDGQLARYKGLASPVGALLDFLMDEIKALLLLGAATIRLYLVEGWVPWLLIGMGGMFVAATGIALTTFMRRPEYVQATGTGRMPDYTGERPPPPPSRSPLAMAMRGVERLGQLVVHYPTWLPIIALVDRLDVFVYVYGAALALYLGRSSLVVLVRLGRPARPAPTPSPTPG